MNKLLSLIVAALFAVASMTAMAQERKAEKSKAEKSMKDTPKKAPTAAQKRQQECNKHADEKKLTGDERNKFVSSCAKPPAKKTDAKAKTDAKKTDKK